MASNGTVQAKAWNPNGLAAVENLPWPRESCNRRELLDEHRVNTRGSSWMPPAKRRRLGQNVSPHGPNVLRRVRDSPATSHQSSLRERGKRRCPRWSPAFLGCGSGAISSGRWGCQVGRHGRDQASNRVARVLVMLLLRREKYGLFLAG